MCNAEKRSRYGVATDGLCTVCAVCKRLYELRADSRLPLAVPLTSESHADVPQLLSPVVPTPARFLSSPEFTYQSGDWLVFGAETSGLPPQVRPVTVRYARVRRIHSTVVAPTSTYAFLFVAQTGA